MDKVLKRRLIGASILIALAVIFLPMLLVSPDDVVDDSRTDVAMPPMPESGREVRRIPLNPETARVREPESEPSPDARRPRDEPPESRVPARTEQPDEIVLVPEREPAPAPDLAATEPPQDVPVDPAPVPEADDVPEASPEPEVESTQQQAQRAADQPQTPLGDWAVQVASFSSRESSEATRSRLESLGHIVNRDEVVRGDSVLYRLRTGPYPSRSAAEQALGQIAATVEGVEPIVRQLDADTIAGRTGFAVQVGSFASQENAERESARLDELGFEAFQVSEDNSGRTVWRVLVGTVADRGEADALRARLSDEAGVEGLVVSHP